MKKLILLLLLVFSIGILPLYSQDTRPAKLTKQEREMYERAEFLFEEKNYLLALPVYLELLKNHPEDYYLKYKAGICYLYKNDEKEKSVVFLEEVYAIDPELDDILFYLGRAYNLNYRFEDAKASLEKYLQQKLTPAEIHEAEKLLRWAENGNLIYGKSTEARIENIGSEINSEYSEYVPLISTDESVLIFTYVGARSKGGLQSKTRKAESDEPFPDPDGIYYEDIFISYKLGDNWLTPESIGDNINTYGHDAAIALSPDGQKLFIFKSTQKDKGDIYLSKLEGENWSSPQHLGPNINTNFWEGSCTISSDDRTLYFSSERPGGLGERDIYKSERQENGEWGPATNLGAIINTSYNEDAPFIHPDGVHLFFSSEGKNSMGGYDIFVSRRIDGEWTAPENLGFPINTTGDDRYYVLTADGRKGFYSSSREDGYGQHDIYTVNPGVIGAKPILALVIGTVTADGQPVSANITVSDADTEEEIGKFNSNSATGKYLLTLTPGNKYKLAFEVEGYDTHIEYVNVESLEAYVQVAKDFHLHSKDKKDDTKLAMSDSSSTLQAQIEEEVQKYKRESTREYYEQVVYNEILKEKGEEVKEGVEYYVDLGKYDAADEKKVESLSSITPLTKETTFEGKTQFTAGPFKSLLEAEIFRQKLIQADSVVALSVVKVNDNGRSKTIKEYYPERYKKIFPDDDQAPITSTKVSEVTEGQNKDVAIVTEKKPEEQLDLKKLVDFEKREIEGLSFKIELGAFESPDDFKLWDLQKYGPIQAKKYEDGITRYTMGPFKTLAEAEAFKQMLVEKEPETTQSFVTVFFFGQRKTVEEFYGTPCDEQMVMANAQQFVGKDLNDINVYTDMLKKLGAYNCNDFIFKVQIGAYRHPKNFKYKKLESAYGPAEVKSYADGITRFTLREYKTIAEAENFRQDVMAKGFKDAWVTAEYKGERKLLEDLFRNNFYLKQGL